MLILEYARKVRIDPTSLINDAPSIWRWTSPNMAIADWMVTLYGLGLDIDTTKVAVYTSAYYEENLMTSVPDYATLLGTVHGFYWNNLTQTAYFNFDGENPHAYATISLSKLFGATNEKSIVFNGLLYPNILISTPTVTRVVEPVIYTRLATQSINAVMKNDEQFRITANRAEKYWRFDDLAQADELIAGQTTFLKYYEDGMAYEDMKLLHKGIVDNCVVTPTNVTLSCADKRSKTDIEWPTKTYRDAGYTDAQVDKDSLDSVVPDGFGYNREMPMACVNRDTALLVVDDDDVLVLPTDQLLNWNMVAWTGSNVITTKSAEYVIAKFPSYRIAKTAANSTIRTTFIATLPVHRISGYMRCDVLNIPEDYTQSYIIGSGGVNINFKLQVCTFMAGSTNTRGKFITNDDGKVICYYSFEVALTVGNVYTYNILIDIGPALTSAIVCAGIRIGSPVYPTFKVAQKILAAGLSVYYEKDDELTEVTNIVSIDEDAGTVALFDVDVHDNGMLDAGLSKLYCSCGLRKSTYLPYNGLNFNGASTYVDLSIAKSAFSLTAGQPFEIEATIQTTDSTHYPTIFQYRLVSHVSLHILEGCAGFEIYDTNISDSFVVGTIPVVDGLPHHIKATYDGTTMRLFVDGVSDGTWLLDTYSAMTDFPYVAIGTNTSTIWTYHFNGAISDVKFSKSGILIAEYLLNEGAGTEAKDSVGAYDGTIVNGAWSLGDVVNSVNPMDIITELNYEVQGIPYLASLYDIALCESEKLKLRDVAMYKNAGAKLSTIIEELQSGSTVGFRYDDIDKIYIFCDDPNRVPTFDIPNGHILNLPELEMEGNLALYADMATVNYAGSRKDDDVLAYINDKYQKGVLLIYGYTNPLTLDSLLTTEPDAIAKSQVILEDLCRTRPMVQIKVHNMALLNTLDLYHIGYVDLKLSAERPFVGRVRVQVTGIEVDTKFGFVYLTLRERVYSSVFADIANSRGNIVVLGDATAGAEFALGDTAVGNELTIGSIGV